MRTVKAWHFTAGDKLRDGRPVPPLGKWLIHDGPVSMCASGLHASVRLLDACKYSPGLRLHRVECAEIITKQDDKLVCRRRRILASMDADVRELREALEKLTGAVAALEGEPISYPLAIPLGFALVFARRALGGGQ